MEFITTVFDLLETGVKIFGAGLAFVGYLDFSEGKSQKNSTKKDEGTEKMLGGGMIFLAGTVLVPKLAEMFI